MGCKVLKEPKRGLVCLPTEIQSLQKLVHIWQNFPWKVNCGPENKDKIVGIFGNKERYIVFVCTKYRNIGFIY